MAKALPLRRGQRLGKYRIERKIGDGGFATVYEATDTIEGVRVALLLRGRVGVRRCNDLESSMPGQLGKSRATDQRMVGLTGAVP